MKKSFSVMSAIIILAACAVTDPNIETAKLNVKNGEFEKAIESVGKAIEMNPANGSAYEYRGNILGEMAQIKIILQTAQNFIIKWFRIIQKQLNYTLVLLMQKQNPC